MSKLDKWLPNKFRRAKSEDRKGGREGGLAVHQSGLGHTPAVLMPMNHLLQSMIERPDDA